MLLVIVLWCFAIEMSPASGALPNRVVTVPLANTQTHTSSSAAKPGDIVKLLKGVCGLSDHPGKTLFFARLLWCFMMQC